MSNIFSDFFDFVGDTVHDVGDVLENTWDSIKHNPIGTITSVVAMAYGIPPMWAGALGGAAGAAATGGDVVKGAFTGGAMGYMGAQAGAATGALGPIAQAAATGAAASATGAILTGQDVMTAVKAGLILGTVSGGVAQLMTPKEAISSVPKDVLNRAATTADPMGTLIDEMGWAKSDSAISAANSVIGSNLKSSITGLADTIPDSVLKEAAALPPGSDANSFIADKMGWENNGITTNASSTALGDYQAANKVVHSYGPVTPESVTNVTPTVTAADTIANTGLVDAGDASVLAHNGYTAADVQNLVKAGYNPADLADMAATGVPASTLTSLSNTQFTEAQINDLLTNHVSANNIADASNLVNSGKLTVATADSLMKNGVNSIDLKSIASSGKADSFAKLMDSGVSRSNAQYMLDKGVDLNKAAAAIDSGKLTGAQLDASVSNNTYNKVITDATTVAPVQPAGGTTTTVAGPQAPAGLDTYLKETGWTPSENADIAKTADQYGTKYEQDLAAQREANMTASQKATMEARLNSLGGNTQQWEQAAGGNDYNTFLKKMGYTADNAYTREAYQRGLDSYTGQQQAATTLQQQQDAYLKAQQPVEPTAPTTDNTGLNILNEQQTAELMKNVNPNMTNSLNVDVSGVPKYAGQQGAGTPPEGFDVATPENVFGPQDTGSASKPFTPGTYYDAESNTWYTPKAQAPAEAAQPIVPVTPPTTQAPTQAVPSAPVVPTTEIPEVTVTAPRVETPVEQPIVPIVTPTVTAPPVVTPPPQTTTDYTTQPVQPSLPPTVVDTKTEDNGNGTSTQVITYSNGSVSTNVILNGNTAGGTPSTTIPEITVTAPKEPPLTPPTQVVIPEQPKIPEVVVPETPTEPVTPEEPVVPEEPNVPIVPIIPPSTPDPYANYPHYNFKVGPTPHINIPTGLNPGWITNVPTHYNEASAAADKYYWGQHPYQPGPTFNPTLYNQTPNAPAQPFGSTYAQTSATPAQILQAMQGRYPLLNTTSVNGPVAP